MTRLFPLLAKFGLFAPKSHGDIFELRLIRIGTREARARSLGLTFRSSPSPRAGAALS